MVNNALIFLQNEFLIISHVAHAETMITNEKNIPPNDVKLIKSSGQFHSDAKSYQVSGNLFSVC